MAAAYRLAGSPGLILLKVAVVAIVIYAVWRRLRNSTPVFAAIALAAVLLCMTPATLTVRPQLWSLLGLVLLLSLLDRDQSPTPAGIAAGATLFCVWANMHGGWITGAAVLAVYAITRVIRERKDVPSWALLCAACAGGTLLNPYGVGLWRFLAATVRTSRPDIGEWAALDFESPFIQWAPLILVLVVALTLTRRSETRPRLEVWAVLVLLVTAAMRVGRVAPLVAPAAFVVLGRPMSKAWGHFGRLSVAASAAVVFWLPSLVGLAAAVQPVSQVFRCLPIRGEWTPDRTTAAFLGGTSGTLLTTFDWGEYAIWHFGPRLKVSIDGRRETVYSDSVVQWHRAFERGEPDAQALVGRLSPDYVWLRSSRPLAREWLIAHGYRIAMENDKAFVAARNDGAAPQAALEPLSACFP